MAWVTPHAFTALELVSAPMLNTYVSDLLTYLKGGAGTVQIDAAMTIQGGTAWHSANDGAGSGLDADLLDGLQGTNFLRDGGMLSPSGAYDLGVASTAGSVVRMIRSQGVTISCTGSAGIRLGSQVVGTMVVALGDVAIFRANTDNYWECLVVYHVT